jgi:protein-tyrosine phosphatase
MQEPAGRMRLVALHGGQNFRDMGGYRSGDGRTVRWGVLYRSGSMHHLTQEDLAILRELGIQTIVDLRSSQEREREPLADAAGFAPAVLAEPYVFADSEMGRALPSAKMEADHARTAFERAYGFIPFQFVNQFRAIFSQLLAGKVPMIINCSGGKDRTGVAAALVLTALGVPHEEVIEDYLLSKVHFRPKVAAASPVGNDSRWRDLAPELMDVLRGVEESYLNAAFKAIEEQSGGLEGYFQAELGLSPADLDQLKSLYLE